MKITVAKSSGFCFGVRRALDISSKIAKTRKNVFVLGDIVHNTFVVKALEKQGIKKINYISPCAKNSRTLIIRAHGAPKKIFENAKKYGYKIIDATCPKVKNIYRIARGLEKTNKIIIIGDKGHNEVKGIAGQLNKKPIVIESVSDISHLKLSSLKKIAAITQSTQSMDNINKIMTKLRRIIPHIKLYNTTCQTTVIKQEELQTLLKNNCLVLIIGSKTSANTKRLFSLSKRINKKTYWIESAKDLKKTWFENVKKVGIMAGASTPDCITRDVVETLK